MGSCQSWVCDVGSADRIFILAKSRACCWSPPLLFSVTLLGVSLLIGWYCVHAMLNVWFHLPHHFTHLLDQKDVLYFKLSTDRDVTFLQSLFADIWSILGRNMSISVTISRLTQAANIILHWEELWSEGCLDHIWLSCAASMVNKKCVECVLYCVLLSAFWKSVQETQCLTCIGMTPIERQIAA